MCTYDSVISFVSLIHSLSYTGFYLHYKGNKHQILEYLELHLISPLQYLTLNFITLQFSILPYAFVFVGIRCSGTVFVALFFFQIYPLTFFFFFF